MATSLQLSWDPPPINTQNGLIINYNIVLKQIFNPSTCNDRFLNQTNDTRNIIVNNETQYVLNGLFPSTTYKIAVLASTRAGSGPLSDSVCVTTPPSGAFTLATIPHDQSQNCNMYIGKSYSSTSCWLNTKIGQSSEFMLWLLLFFCQNCSLCYI